MIHIDAIAHQSRFSQVYTRERITIIIGSIIISVLLNQISVYAVLLLTSLAYILFVTRQKLGIIMKIMMVPLLFVGVSSFLVAVTFSNVNIVESRWQLRLFDFYVGITDKSMNLAFMTLIRSISTVIQALSLSLTIPMIRVIDWMRWVRLPQSFVQLFTLSYRMIFVVYEVSQDLITSQSLILGFKNPILTFKTLTGMSTSLFMNTFHRLNDMEIALKLRNFHEKL